ncbi:hypothetical protein vseg_011773 [Gypsophila vaccaria]
MMGNRWSAIATRLPGRTDNEIKNVWHTHLKKRLNKQDHTSNSHAKVTKKNCEIANKNLTSNSNNSYSLSETSSSTSNQVPNSSQQTYNTSDDFSSLTDVSSVSVPNKTSSTLDAHEIDAKEFKLDEYPIIDDTFWSIEEFSYDDIDIDFDYSNIIQDEMTLHAPEKLSSNSTIIQGDNLDFWLDVFCSASGVPHLPEF